MTSTALAPRRISAAVAAPLACLLAAACGEENKYVAPPPPAVTVMNPIQKPYTRYLETTGSTAAVNTVKLVARVSGFVQEIKYQDGSLVTAGTPLFVIEPEPYKLKLEQAQASVVSAEANLKQAEAEFKRQEELVAKQVSTQANYDQALGQRDADRGNLDQAKASEQQAEINYGYTTVKAPFDGIVTARLVSVGELVGATNPTQLASIVQADPIWANFNIGERDVLTVRAEIKRRGLTPEDLKRVPVEIGLQTEQGFPHRGTLDYAAPTVDASTGTLAARGVFPNKERVLLPGYFVRVRVPVEDAEKGILVPDSSVGSDQGGRYVLTVNKDNVVEQRRVELGPLVDDLRVIEKGLSTDDRVIVAGLLRAIPGQKVDPQMKSAEARPAGAK
jgi:RND family efflux transporter MFP subunit